MVERSLGKLVTTADLTNRLLQYCCSDNKLMCSCKNEAHVANYCNYRLSRDILALQYMLTLTKQKWLHIVKVTSYFLNRMRDNNVLQ